MLFCSLSWVVLSSAAALAHGSSAVERSNEDCPIARTKQGIYRGTQIDEKVEAFLGVPYAEPPVGDRRFHPAVPPIPADANDCSITDATGFGPVCWQFHYRTVMLNNTMETTPQSEDCLNANVFIPRQRSESELLPVLLWSYGGAFSEGGGSMPGKFSNNGVPLTRALSADAVFNPRNLVASQGNMIVVTFK